MDRRSFCKVLGFAAGSTLLPGLMVQAAGQSSVGHAVPDGRYTIGIRSDLSGCDLTHTFYYSDSFFTHPATQYDHQLALATLGLVCAAANTVASDAEYWVNGSVGREAHIAAAYEALGFGDALFCNYDLDTGRAGDFVGYSLARKTLTLNGQRTTLVALVLRGGGYGGEWASNFHMGDTSAHTGFVTPVAAVFASLKAYLARAGQGGAFKLWLGGYSRGSIIANLLAAKIARELPQLGRENIYAYGFAVPAALTAADRPDLQQDFDANHAPDAPCWKAGPRATSSASFPAATRWPGCCPLPGATTATAVTAFCPPPGMPKSWPTWMHWGRNSAPRRWWSAALPPPRTPAPSSTSWPSSAFPGKISTRNTKPPSWT